MVTVHVGAMKYDQLCACSMSYYNVMKVQLVYASQAPCHVHGWHCGYVWSMNYSWHLCRYMNIIVLWNVCVQVLLYEKYVYVLAMNVKREYRDT